MIFMSCLFQNIYSFIFLLDYGIIIKEKEEILICLSKIYGLILENINFCYIN